MTTSTAATPESKAVSADPALDLRQTLGCFPTGVTIVTCLNRHNDPIGLTVSSFNSVSMDPPLILWSLQSSSMHLDDFCAASHFAVNVLAADQADLCQRFSRDVEDRFAAIDWTLSAHKLPIIANVAATLECRTEARYPGGDHEIFIGHVLSHNHSDRTPMLFGKGRIAAFPANA